MLDTSRNDGLKESFYVFWFGVGGGIPVADRKAEQTVAHGAADEITGKSGRLEHRGEFFQVLRNIDAFYHEAHPHRISMASPYEKNR